MTETIIEIKNKETGFAVIIDDDGRTAYAYLKNPAGKIVSDVWLYNVLPAPDKPEWTNPSNAPFLNPKAYAKPDSGLRVQGASDVSVNWGIENSITKAIIELHGKTYAILKEREKPGWSSAAAVDGPLAKTLSSRL